jgi:hypothetical protein
MDDWPPRCNHRGDAGVRLRKTDLDHGRHSAFFKFANNYRCRAGDPCEGKFPDRHAVFSPCRTGASDAAHSTLELISFGSGAVGKAGCCYRRRSAGAPPAVSDRAGSPNNPSTGHRRRLHRSMHGGRRLPSQMKKGAQPSRAPSPSTRSWSRRDIRARVDTGLSQSLAAPVGEQVLIAVPVEVARADQPLELFRLQLLAGGLSLQLSDDLLHSARSPESARSACSLARRRACSRGTPLGLPRCWVGPAIG